jgi:hypothetical protein
MSLLVAIEIHEAGTEEGSGDWKEMDLTLEGKAMLSG